MHGDGCSEPLMLAHGFTRTVLVELILAEVATAPVEVIVVRITEGRRANATVMLGKPCERRVR